MPNGATAQIWGWDGTIHREVLVDSSGHLQVDVLSGVGVASQCYGYDGAAWQTLLVESSTDKNLRVSLYYSGIKVDGITLPTDLSTNHALLTAATLYGKWSAATMKAVNILTPGADEHGLANIALLNIDYLYGFNGATWDRLRSYPTGILKVGRAEVGLLDVRMTGTGQVGAAGARKLFWMAVNPSAGLAALELTDATASGGAIVFDHFHTARESHFDIFDPPMEFSNGIYVETFTNMTSVIFGYL